jgi:hypothetical protein
LLWCVRLIKRVSLDGERERAEEVRLVLSKVPERRKGEETALKETIEMKSLDKFRGHKKKTS